jgi:hypothetical protein
MEKQQKQRGGPFHKTRPATRRARPELAERQLIALSTVAPSTGLWRIEVRAKCIAGPDLNLIKQEKEGSR